MPQHDSHSLWLPGALLVGPVCACGVCVLPVFLPFPDSPDPVIFQKAYKARNFILMIVCSFS